MDRKKGGEGKGELMTKQQIFPIQLFHICPTNQPNVITTNIYYIIRENL